MYIQGIAVIKSLLDINIIWEWGLEWAYYHYTYIYMQIAERGMYYKVICVFMYMLKFIVFVQANVSIRLRLVIILDYPYCKSI